MIFTSQAIRCFGAGVIILDPPLATLTLSSVGSRGINRASLFPSIPLLAVGAHVKGPKREGSEKLLQGVAEARCGGAAQFRFFSLHVPRSRAVASFL